MDLHRLDSDAVRSIQRLGARGYDSYLVGGCVRDLLLDCDPKDFDIATEARPQQVKRAFPRNCRIIGRRFKLAHLHFDGNQKILEVATFRSSPLPAGSEGNGEDPTELDRFPDADVDASGGEASEASSMVDAPDADTTADGLDDEADLPTEEDDSDEFEAGEPQLEDDLLIVRDNEFGSIEEDALRRDFTINALFLDPLKDEIIDYVDGIADVEARIIRTIGDPITRFREDPIRILRAVKFAGRLSFTFDPDTQKAMQATAPDLVRAAPPRILEEILRLLRGGHALPSFQILRSCGGLAPLLPRVHEYLNAADDDERRIFWRLLEALDNHIHNGAKPSNAVLLGCLFLRPILIRFASEEGRSSTTIAEEMVGPLAVELRLPRRDTGALKRICSVHPRFTASGKRRFRLASFLQDPHLLEAFDLFELSCLASGEHFEDLERWRELIAEQAPIEEAPRDDHRSEPRRKKSKKARQSRSVGRPETAERAGPKDRSNSRRGRNRGAEPERARRDSGKKSAAKQRDRSVNKKVRKQDEVLTIEPQAIDVSAFDRELGHREVPRFDTIVEDAGGASKTKRRVKIRDDDSYKPPPPPGSGNAPQPPSPPSTDDVFGDW